MRKEVEAVRRQLSRFLHQEVNRISSTTEERLGALFGEEGARLLRNALHDPLGCIPLGSGQEWAEKRLEELLHAEEHTLAHGD
jgi:hypothetical protein